METFQFVVFLILCLVHITLQGRAFGGRPLAISRIVGGDEALPHEFPWLIHFINSVSRTNVCGGAIIEERWVISAAHCFRPDSLSRFSLVAGDHNQKVHENTEQEFKLKTINVHQAYIFDEFEHDIALVEIDGTFTFNEYVQPISLPIKDEIMNGICTLKNAMGNLTVAGWGILQEGSSPPPDVLRKVTLPIVPIDDCIEQYDVNDGEESIITKNMLCAGVMEGGKDSCNGDSGSPGVCVNEVGEPILCGIVSFGFGCARPSFPGVYTRVSSYIDWISSPEATRSNASLLTYCISTTIVLAIKIFLFSHLITLT